jgi:hypothetical protein
VTQFIAFTFDAAAYFIRLMHDEVIDTAWQVQVPPVPSVIVKLIRCSPQYGRGAWW